MEYLVRGVLADEDDLLEANTNINIVDQSFRDADRFPVNELFAGRNSAHINDADFDKRHADEARIVNNLRGTLTAELQCLGLHNRLMMRRKAPRCAMRFMTKPACTSIRVMRVAATQSPLSQLRVRFKAHEKFASQVVVNRVT